jgi:hypothetical protein
MDHRVEPGDDEVKSLHIYGIINFGFSEINLTKSDFWIMDTPSRSFQRGRLAIVTDAGRDAVDADGAIDERC